MLIDITRTIWLDTLTYPGDAPASLEQVASLERGDLINLAHMNLSCHTGTHIDAPAHFIRDGATLDSFPPERFVLDALVLEKRGEGDVGPAELARLDLRKGEAVLLKTRNGSLPRSAFSGAFTGLSAAGARLLVERGVSMVGIDYLSVERDDDPAYPVHNTLLGAGVLIVEDLDLRAVQPGRYRLYCLPLRICGTEAAPCRALLEMQD